MKIAQGTYVKASALDRCRIALLFERGRSAARLCRTTVLHDSAAQPCFMTALHNCAAQLFCTTVPL